MIARALEGIWRGVRYAALVVPVALTALPGAARAETVRVGLFVGSNVGFGGDDTLIYAEDEARDMARLFQDMGDLSRDRVAVIQGADAREVQEAMRATEAQVREISARGDEALLIFYYSGHASRDGLHLEGTLLPMDALRRWLEGSSAQVRVAFVDACESGALARSRGGAPVEAIEISVADSLTLSGLAIVTSTGPLSVARESDSFGGGVFSRALITGLRGSADMDIDGQITLDEAYRYAFEETVMSTAGGRSSIQRPEYRLDLEGVGEVVLTRVPSRAAGLTLSEELEGVYTVVSVSSGQVVARIDKAPGEVRRLSLPTGRYVVRKVRREDVLLAEVDLVWGGDRWIEDAQMSSVQLGDPLARGGWSPRPVQLSARMLGATPVTTGWPATVGGELAGRYLLGPTLGLGGFVGWERGGRDEWSGWLEADVGRAGIGLVHERRLSRLDLVLGGGLEAVLFNQRVHYITEGESEELQEEIFSATQLGPGGWAQAGAHLPVGPAAGLEVGVRAHLYRATLNEQPTSLVEGQGYVGVSARLGRRRIARARRGDGA